MVEINRTGDPTSCRHSRLAAQTSLVAEDDADSGIGMRKALDALQYPESACCRPVREYCRDMTDEADGPLRPTLAEWVKAREETR
jgi:hypothetical protein